LAGNAKTSGLYRLGPSLAGTLPAPTELAAAWTDSASRILIGNLHDYSGGTAPESATGGGWGISVQAAIDTYNQLLTPGTPIWTTEIGFKTAGSAAGHPAVTQRAAAKYILRSLLLHLELGIRRFYIYDLVDSLGEFFGMVTAANVVKQQFTAVKSWIALMSDPGVSFSPGSLSYSVVGDQTNIKRMLFQKRNGRFYLAIWQAVNSSSGTTDGTLADVESTARALTMITQTTWTTVNVYEPSFGVSTVATFSSVSQFAINVDDHVMLVEMIP
jgi:hypothetical protein